MSRLGEPVGALWSRLTDRDRRILQLVADHRVLTTDQLAVLEFGSRTRAQHRLHELYALDVLWRFRFPRVAGGSYPWHYALGYTGARLLAAAKAVRPPRPTEHVQLLERLVESPKLRHQLGVNDFFVSLVDYAQRQGWPKPGQPGGGGLEVWRSEGWITEFHSDQVRPDGFGSWLETDQLTPFYLEYDTGTESLDRVAAKLSGYDRACRAASYPVFGVVLFTLATTRREAGVRAVLTRTLAGLDSRLLVATTARDYGHPDGPAGPVWAPVTTGPESGHRVRLGAFAGACAPAAAPADEVITPPATADRGQLPRPDPIPVSTGWLDDEESTGFVDLGPDPGSWTA